LEEDDGYMPPPVQRRRLPASPFNAARDAIPPDEVFSVCGTVAVDADFGTGTRRVSTPTPKMHKL
jgi:hypothetical protein